MKGRNQKVREIPPESLKEWGEVFAAIDAMGVRDGFVIERDMRPAEERPFLNEFLDGADSSA